MKESFGPYRLVKRLATGGMAEVFLAFQTGIEGFEREVVIKRILPHRAQDAEFCTMFLDEARLVARLNHPHIAQIYDLGKLDDTYFIAMEYVRGLDLAHLLDLATEQRTPGLPDVVAVPVVIALCEALHYIHTRTDELGNPLDIVHRDLNPKNVIVSFDGGVKLIDFGIAKAASQVYETRTGVIKGTYGYMAPEQITRQNPVDSRADLFALGVLAYELTTGIHPFDAPDEVAVLSKLVRGTFAPPGEATSDYPRDLEKIVLSLMAVDVEERARSAREVLARLERFALSRGLPNSMSRIADYVRLQISADGQVDGVPAPSAKEGASTARVSERLKARADNETAELATAFLRRGSAAGTPTDSAPALPKPKAKKRRRGTKSDTKAKRSAPPAEWPWSSWGKRERLLAGAAALVVLLAGVSTTMLIATAMNTPDDGPQVADLPEAGAQPHDPLRQEGQPVNSPNLLHVRSDPAGATISVDGRLSERVTPAAVQVPDGRRLVWIRVELAGYRPEERQVEVSAGAAVFSLSPGSEGARAPNLE